MRQESSTKFKSALLTGAIWIASVFVPACCARGQEVTEPNSVIPGNVASSMELARNEREFSTARLEPARMGSDAGIAVIFEGTEDLHYYAKAETATAPGFELKVQAQSDGFEFSQ